MTTAEEIRISFIEALEAHFVVRRHAADRFISDLTAALAEERFSAAVLKEAANRFVKTRTTSGFPSVALCIATCHDVQANLSVSLEEDDHA